MSSTLMTLGSIAFYTPFPGLDRAGFETMDRDSQYSWMQQARLSRSPAMQFTGIGEESVTIAGKLYPNQFGGLSTIEALRQAGAAGKPLILTRYYPLENADGLGGDPIGKYGITRIREGQHRIGINGVAHKVDFLLELKAYGEEPGSGSFENPEFIYV